MTSLIHGLKNTYLGLILLGVLLSMAGLALSDSETPAKPSTPRSMDLNKNGSKLGVADLLDRPSVQVSHPEKCVLLGITKTGDRVVAVGERGIVVLSDDDGQTWRQAKVPTSVSLTAVAFPAKDSGWAIGHSGVVLHTKDGGETWTRQLDGIVAGRLALDAAKQYAEKVGSEDPLATRFIRDARLLIDDGADKPFLDLHFRNVEEGIIVGAYGLVFHTNDGGETWESWMPRIDNPDGFHFYTIQRDENTIYLAGEQGLYFRSLDGGETFHKIDTPYRGSYFTSTITGTGDLVISGMRGNSFSSSDQGSTFHKMDVPAPVSILASTSAADGAVLFVNQAGQVLRSDRSRPLNLQIVDMPRLGAMVSSVVQLDDSVLLGVGNIGLIRISLPAVNVKKTGGEL